MNKVALKKAKAAEFGMRVDNPSLIDTHRHTPKAEGGDYTPENYTIMTPPDHMRQHGNYREREEWMEVLKAAVDQRRQVINLHNKANNQLLAYKRRSDHLDQATVKWLEEQAKHLKKELGKFNRRVEKAVKDYGKVDKLAEVALNVHGIGPLTIAQCLVYIDLGKARHASSLWSYVGLDKPSHERYAKGEAGGGNKTLRTALYTMADSQIKSRGPYREVYDRTKARLEQSEKITSSRNTQGKLVEVAWKDAKPCHRHGAAIRAMVKHFLADYWFVGRELFGLENGPCYAESQLGKTHKTVSPRERGWDW